MPAGSILRTGQRQLIARALIDAGVSSSPVGEDGLLAAADTTRVGTIVRAGAVADLGRALTASGIHAVPLGDDGFRAEADQDLVGKIAFAAGVPLVELRPADGAGLEEIFLELTADTQREGAAA